MNTNDSLLVIGNIEAVVVQKNIKNLHLSVLPPNGMVKVTAPIGTKEDVIRVFLTSKSSWIKKQQVKYINQRRQFKREYVTGETHYYLGQPYRLIVKNDADKNKIYIKGKRTIMLEVKSKTSNTQKERIVTEWYRVELKNLLNELIKKWQPKFKTSPESWKIRRMKTKWGSYNTKTNKILINLELIKKPYNCIEYVVVHEWLHLIEPKHNKHFVELLDKYLPNWRARKEELDAFILSYEKWKQ